MDHPAKETNSKIQKGSHRYYGTMNKLKEAISTILKETVIVTQDQVNKRPR